MTDGLQMMKENMEALNSGEELPHQESLEVVADAPTEEPPETPVEEPTAEIPEEAEHKAPEHMTEEEWIASGRAPEDYLTQEQFDKVGEMRNENPTSLAKQVVGMQKTLQDFMSQQNKVLEENSRRVREETIKELEAKKQEAIDLGDTSAAIELHDQIKEQQEPEVKQEDEENPNQSYINEWYSKNNDWFNVDQNATGLMNVELARAERDGLPVEEGFARAEAKVKKQFGYLFGDIQPEPKPEPPRRPTAISERSTKTATQKKSYKFSDLPPEIQGMARTVAKQCKQTEEEYVKSFLENN